MRNNETGEFELVVGDRQLLSAFFIVVLLCAVAFAMGYVVGQNAPRSGKTSAENTAAPATNSTADQRPQPLPPAPTQQPAAAATPASDTAAPAESGPQPTTQPSQSVEPVKASAPAPTQAAPAPAPAAASSGIIAADDLPQGSYWQVMAVGQPQAEILRTTLKDHGFSVVLSPGTKGLIRVLVGPYADTQSLGKAKTDLEAAGMHPLRYKP